MFVLCLLSIILNQGLCKVRVRNRNIYYFNDGGTFEVFGLDKEGIDCDEGVTIKHTDDRADGNGFVRKTVTMDPWRDIVQCKVAEHGAFNLTFVDKTSQSGVNSSSSQYLFLLTVSPGEPPMLSCGNSSGGLELRKGVSRGAEWCCADQGGLCSMVMYQDPGEAVVALNKTIVTGYGFSVVYNLKLWPKEEIQTRFECGRYKCDNCNITKQDMGKVWQLKVIVLYLTVEFTEATNCTLTLSYRDFLIDIQPTHLQLINSSLVVSSVSTIGFQQYDLDTPLWKYDQDGVVSEPFTKDVSKLLNKNRMCVVRRGRERVEKILMPVKYNQGTGFSISDRQKHLESGGRISCSAKYFQQGGWSPELGADSDWYQYNLTWSIYGEQISNVVAEKSDMFVNLTTVGIYKCSLTLTYTGNVSYGPVQPLIISEESNVVAPPDPTTHPPPPSTTTPHKVVSSTKVDPLYIGLIITVSLILLTVALASFKMLRSNREKVDQLDVKFALVEVKKKMGVNSLYSHRDEELGQLDDIDSIVRQIEKRNLEFQQIIGQGQFGKVIKATLMGYDMEGSETVVAVKTLTQSSVSSQADFLKEVTSMYLFDHVNVLKLLGVCTDNTPCLIVTEYMLHGDLKEYLMNDDVRLTMRDKLSICHQVASGLEHISSHKIVHRDVAARNCLVGEGLLIKVADFGLSRNVGSADYYQKEGGQVPIRWMAPEAIQFGRYTTENDIWAFGVLVWEVFTDGEFPYNVYSNQDVLASVVNGLRLPKPAFCSEDISILMNSCWQEDQLLRPTFLYLQSQLAVMLRNERDSWLLLESETASTSLSQLTGCCEGNEEGTPFISRNKYSNEPQVSCETSL